MKGGGLGAAALCAQANPALSGGRGGDRVRGPLGLQLKSLFPHGSARVTFTMEQFFRSSRPPTGQGIARRRCVGTRCGFSERGLRI